MERIEIGDLLVGDLWICEYCQCWTKAWVYWGNISKFTSPKLLIPIHRPLPSLFLNGSLIPEKSYSLFPELHFFSKEFFLFILLIFTFPGNIFPIRNDSANRCLIYLPHNPMIFSQNLFLLVHPLSPPLSPPAPTSPPFFFFGNRS